MQGAATILHHPVHPVLVAFPIAFFVGSLGADIIFLISRREFWGKCALALIGFGVIGGLVAAVAGLVDYRSAPMTADAFEDATDHLIANLALIGVFVVNFLVRWRRLGQWFGYVLTVAGFLTLMYAGWLGGELVFRHAVGVAPEGRPAIVEPAEPAAH